MTMFNFFKNKPKAVVRYRVIDWAKVTSVQELTSILAACKLFDIRVAESHWDQFEHLLKDSE